MIRAAHLAAVNFTEGHGYQVAYSVDADRWFTEHAAEYWNHPNDKLFMEEFAREIVRCSEQRLMEGR